MLLDVIGCYWMLLGVIGCYWVLLGVIGYFSKTPITHQENNYKNKTNSFFVLITFF